MSSSSLHNRIKVKLVKRQEVLAIGRMMCVINVKMKTEIMTLEMTIQSIII